MQTAARATPEFASTRAIERTAAVARTVAHLAAAVEVSAAHLAEALQFRSTREREHACTVPLAAPSGRDGEHDARPRCPEPIGLTSLVRAAVPRAVAIVVVMDQ